MSTHLVDVLSRWLEVELWIICGVAFASLLLKLRRASREPEAQPRERRLSLTADIVVAFVYLAFAASQTYGPGRPVFGLSVAMPGSIATRFAIGELDPAGRRLIEPVLVLLLAAIFTKGVCSQTRALASKRALLFESWVVLLLIESLVALLRVRFPLQADPFRTSVLDWVRLGLLQVILLVTAVDMLRSGAEAGRQSGHGFKIGTRMVCGYLAATLAAVLSAAGVTGSVHPLLVGAHYYSWFPENWSHGYVLKELDPPAGPKLGEYTSGEDHVVSQHVSWARAAGIDFFVLDWWPSRRSQRGWALKTFNSPEAADFRFAVQLETLDLKDARDKRIKGEARDLIYLSGKRIERLKRAIEQIASELMVQPHYLRIEGRPVIFLYASRHLLGPVPEVLAGIREEIRRRFGFDLYIVGDEVYEHVVGYSPRGQPVLLPQFEPNWDRIAAFDAITCYNPYVAEHLEFAGAAGSEKFLDFGAELYRRYQATAKTMGIPFFPGILPGYNDRGVRAKENHLVVPREGPAGSFFESALKRWGEPFLDSRQPAILITSWNEWNEGTNIEPETVSTPTNDDSSGLAQAYTAGEFFGGHGCTALEQLESWTNSIRLAVTPLRNGP